MSEGGGILSAQTQAMIAQLRRYQSDQVGEILGRGHGNAGAVVRSAYAQARESVDRAVQRERNRREAAAIKAQARAETQSRLDTQLRVGHLLAAGWAQLPGVLTARWRDPEKRRSWWQGALVEACQRLLGDGFLIEYAPGPSSTELSGMRSVCGHRKVTLQSVEALQGGVRISTQGACLDASVASILADQDRVQSLLLAAYQAGEPGEVGGDA